MRSSVNVVSQDHQMSSPNEIVNWGGQMRSSNGVVRMKSSIKVTMTDDELGRLCRQTDG